MLKMGLPEGAVVQRMKINGVSEEIVKSVLAREVPDPNAGAAAAAPANPMASAFAAITSGDPSALLKKTDGPQASGASSASTPSNPGSALAAAAAAASKRRMKSGDELALEIEESGRQGNLQNLKENIDNLEVGLKKLEEELKAHFATFA